MKKILAIIMLTIGAGLSASQTGYQALCQDELRDFGIIKATMAGHIIPFLNESNEHLHEPRGYQLIPGHDFWNSQIQCTIPTETLTATLDLQRSDMNHTIIQQGAPGLANANIMKYNLPFWLSNAGIDTLQNPHPRTYPLWRGTSTGPKNRIEMWGRGLIISMTISPKTVKVTKNNTVRQVANQAPGQDNAQLLQSLSGLYDMAAIGACQSIAQQKAQSIRKKRKF